MSYKKVILGIVCLLATFGVRAEEEVQRQNLFDAMPNVEIIQYPAVSGLLQAAIAGGHQELVEMEGYRVQVYSSNQQQTAKSEALKLELILKDKVEQSVYVLYLPPFWKVRVGDFRTINEARDYKKDFVQQFPKLMGDTYIVRDKIKVLQ